MLYESYLTVNLTGSCLCGSDRDLEWGGGGYIFYLFSILFISTKHDPKHPYVKAKLHFEKKGLNKRTIIRLL